MTFYALHCGRLVVLRRDEHLLYKRYQRVQLYGYCLVRSQREGRVPRCLDSEC
jgi:hypothetical protein